MYSGLRRSAARCGESWRGVAECKTGCGKNVENKQGDPNGKDLTISRRAMNWYARNGNGKTLWTTMPTLLALILNRAGQSAAVVFQHSRALCVSTFKSFEAPGR